MKATRTLLVLGTVLSLLLGAPAIAAEKEGVEEEWDVNAPRGEFQTVTIDTTETTWSNVDVSPDGRALVFDMLGDLYTVPMTGGEATALTNEIAWNFQPRFSPDGAALYIAEHTGQRIAVWDVAQGRVKRSFGLDERPNGLALTPDEIAEMAYRTAARNSTRRRPIRSESGPATIIARVAVRVAAMPSRVALSRPLPVMESWETVRVK